MADVITCIIFALLVCCLCSPIKQFTAPQLLKSNDTDSREAIDSLTYKNMTQSTEYSENLSSIDSSTDVNSKQLKGYTRSSPSVYSSTYADTKQSKGYTESSLSIESSTHADVKLPNGYTESSPSIESSTNADTKQPNGYTESSLSIESSKHADIKLPNGYTESSPPIESSTYADTKQPNEYTESSPSVQFPTYRDVTQPNVYTESSVYVDASTHIDMTPPTGFTESSVFVGSSTNPENSLPNNLTAVAMASLAKSIEDSQHKMESLLRDMRQRTDLMFQSVLTAMTGLFENVANILQAQIAIPKPPPRDCADIADRGFNVSSRYTITPYGQKSYGVFCDLETEGGGWTVFQRRFDGSIDFYREWQDYVNGFGKPFGEYWAGLELLHQLTKTGTWELLVHIEDFNDNIAFAHYASFRVGDADSNYRLSIGAYDGTAGDAMTADNHNRQFSTKDNDNDDRSWGNCAQYRRGAWWYGSCSKANLNGLYLGPKQNTDTGLYWWEWKYSYEVLKKSEMKMRRI